MNGGLVVRFAILVVAEIVFVGTLNLFDDWTLQQMPARFVGAAFASGIAYLAAVSHFPPKIDVRKQAMIFWAVAVVLRIAALPLVPSDLLTRHQWEGKVQRAGFNPYLLAPSDSQLDDLRHDFPEAAKINHSELRALDPPGAEFLFKLIGGVTDRPIFYKILFAIADLASAAVLLRLIGGEERYRDGAWYAWNPLVVYSFAGAAHFDSTMILALVAGILALVKSERESAQQWLWALLAAALFGIAISFNVFAASLVLICLFALRWRAIALVVTVCIPILLSFPFGLQNVWKSLGQLTQLPRLNDFFWWLIEVFWDNPHQRNFHYYPILIVCVVTVSLFFIRDWQRGALWALGTALILSPILHPWYCTWILSLATWRRAYGWHVLSITLLSYYLFWDERLFALPWHADPWMRELIIAPVLAAMIMLAAARKRAVARAI
jgi:hypothetical protein